MDYDSLNDKLNKGSNKTMFYSIVIPINPMGEVLLGERKSDGIWTTPGGGAELNENPEQAAIREAFEEAGLVIIPSMLESLGVKQAPNGKPVHCYLVRTNQTNFSVKMDPDREVSGWNWYSRENLPDGLSRQKNANRLETITQALMKFYGLVKSTEDSLIEKLDKGGKGSGIKGHRTAAHVESKIQNLDAATKREAEAEKKLTALQDKQMHMTPEYEEAAKEYKAAVRARQAAIREGKRTVAESKTKNVPQSVINGQHTGPQGRIPYAGGGKFTPKAERDAKNKKLREAIAAMITERDKEDIKKGGPGSGKRGHTTPKETGFIRNRKTGKMLQADKFFDELASNLTGLSGFSDKPGHFMSMHQIAAAIEKETGHSSPVAYDLAMRMRRNGRLQHMGKIFVVTKKSEEITDELKKGGEGSGVRGHLTAKKIIPHAASPGAQINKIEAHLNLLENGNVIPGVHTASGKPVVTSMDAARAQGYTEQDHVDAMNINYNLAQKVTDVIHKMKMAGREVPKEAGEIAKFHEKMMRQHMKARDHLEASEERLKNHKKKVLESAKKSVTQMGSGLGDRDLDIGSYAQARSKADQEWLEKLHSGMQDFDFGDEPRHFDTNRGVLHLCKVDDGLYSGFFTIIESVVGGELQDNAKVRIERITIPELVQFMMAKEWISPVLEETAPQPAPEVQMPPPSLVELVPQPLYNDSLIETVTEKLSSPLMDQRIKMLELVTKLLS